MHSEIRIYPHRPLIFGNISFEYICKKRDFLRDIGNVPKGTLWRSFGMLEVCLPPNEYILALKLLAGRQKDRDDIYALCQLEKVVTRQQAQLLVDRYIPNKQIQQMNSLDDTLTDFFPQ
ncbi:MAG TPA: hypothetical protein VNG51_28100 [Ktedonobacteraceae bacterium]|nr:hypothetical protein [Ktedonobacteraceae bacterium]